MINVGIVGVGYGAEIQAQALQVNRSFSLYGVTSLDYNQSKRAKKGIGFRYVFTDWKELVTNRKTELILVATPPHSHYEIAKEALLNNKHVLVTAPFVLDVNQAEELTELAGEREKVAVVDHHLNYLPARKYAIHLIQSGKIGNLVSVNRLNRNAEGMSRKIKTRWKYDQNQGGGVFWRYASHDVDYLLRVAGGINWAKYTETQNIVDRIDEHDEPMQAACDDTGTLLLKFHNGVKATINLDTMYPGKPVNEFVFNGERRILYLRNDTELFLYDFDGNRERIAIPPNFQITSIPGAAERSPFYMLSEAVAEAIANRGNVSPTFEEAVHIQRAMEAAFNSRNNNQWQEVGADVLLPKSKSANSGAEVKKIFE